MGCDFKLPKFCPSDWSEMNKDKKKVALIGPILANGGIATVVKTIISIEKSKNNYEFLIFNTSNYKDSSSFINMIIFIKATLFYLTKLILSKIDIAHIHTSSGKSFYRKIFFILLSYFFRIKIILHLHSSKFDEFFISPIGLKMKIIAFFLKKADVLILLCRNWKEKIEKKYSLKNVFVINNPVPFDTKIINENKQRLNSDLVNILFLGFLIKTKGIYDLVVIADRLSVSSPSHKIFVCGKGEEEKKFLEEINRRDLKNIEYVGWVSGEKRIYYYKNSDIFLLPSYNEGMPMVLLEALAFGLPIISTNIAGIPDVVINRKNGFLLEPGNIDDFVEKLRLLILNKKLRREFGKESKIIATRFEKEKIYKKWCRVYQKVLFGN